MLGDFPLWLAGLLLLQWAIIALLIVDGALTQRRLNQDERLLERLILGDPDKRILKSTPALPDSTGVAAPNLAAPASSPPSSKPSRKQARHVP